MECVVAILVSLAYWTGFFVAYFIVFKPYDDSWGGWIKSAGLSAVLFITIPLKYCLENLIWHDSCKNVNKK